LKSTLARHATANPLRTTLAHLRDGDEPALAAAPWIPAQVQELPTHTANPRRTVLDEEAQQQARVAS
jgi:hypothetical protein